jgi:hypothetical protein
VGPQVNLDVALGAALAILPGVGLVGVALIVLALRLRGLQGDLNPRGGNE